MNSIFHLLTASQATYVKNYHTNWFFKVLHPQRELIALRVFFTFFFKKELSISQELVMLPGNSGDFNLFL